MRAVVQRVAEADVVVFEPDLDLDVAIEEDRYNILDPDDDMAYPGHISGRIGGGLVVFLGVEVGDTVEDAAYMAEKICGLRIYEDQEGKMNLCIKDMYDESILAVSQFTLLGDVRKGKRPSFTAAERPERANELYRNFVENVKALGVSVEEGEFQAQMLVRLQNYGPVTILIDSRKTF